LRLAFAGTPPFAVPTLDALHSAGHEIRGVFTQIDRPAGRGRALQASAVKQRALALDLPVHQPASFKSAEALDVLRRLDVDAFVVVAYGLILPPAALALPPLGCFNVHASLLPRWRGAAPIQRAILAGDTETGVSIMRMEPGLDTGPVYATRRVPIGSTDTAQSLSRLLAQAGAELLGEVLDDLARGSAIETPQEEAHVSYAAKIDKAEAPIDWHASVADIDRRVRAFVPWPVAETDWHGERLRIWEAAIQAETQARDMAVVPGTVLAVSAQGIDVTCGRGVLRLKRVQRPGRTAVDARSFANAGPLAGERLGRRRARWRRLRRAA